jgi:hypothetical protein
MLIPIAIDLSLTNTDSTMKHDFGDATALVNYLTTTPCVLLHNGESFETSRLFALLDTLPPGVRENLKQYLLKMPTYRVADWNGTCGQAFPPYSYFRGSIFVVPRGVFESLTAGNTSHESVTIHSGQTDITMWHTIHASRVHQRAIKIHRQHVDVGTDRDVLWGQTFEAIVKHTKIRAITIIDRYAFKRGDSTDTKACALSFVLNKLHEQSKNRENTIAVTIIIQADKYSEYELASITDYLSEIIADKTKISSLHICAMTKQTMSVFFHERYVYTETTDGVLYEAMIGRGISLFSSENVKLASILTLTFHWLAGDSTLYIDAKKRTSSFRHSEWYRNGKVFVNVEG